MVTVLVNGLPGAGKTTLARALADALTLPLFSKDSVKETWADTLEAVRPPACTPGEWSRMLGAAAGESLWTLLADARGAAVLECPRLVRGAAGSRPRPLRRPCGRHLVHREGAGTFDGDGELWARGAEPLGFGASTGWTPHDRSTYLPCGSAQSRPLIVRRKNHAGGYGCPLGSA